ncbi:MAG: glycoside hydrolase family 5 protein [Rhizomicrobium sp.]|jgi:endoglucanase
MTSFFGVSCFATAVLFLVTTASAGAASSSSQPAVDPFVQTGTMHRGVNVVAWTPPWEDPARPRFEPKHFVLIRDAGFDTVVLILWPFSHMDASSRLDPAWLERLDKLVQAGLDSGVTVVLSPEDPATNRQKLDAFWRQIAPRYKDSPARLLFQILDEPEGASTPGQWNVELRKTLAIIRQTNPARNVLVGSLLINGDEDLSTLDLPAGDRHLIAVVHYFLPMEFTHQGASWVEATKNLSGVTWGSDADRALLDKNFGAFKTWSVAHHRPIFLGSFGAYDAGEIGSRVKWDWAVARAAEAHGIPWVYWQFDYNFNVYDVPKEEWVQPILKALIPEGK